MGKIEWRVDGGTYIVLRHPLFARRKVELNGQPVQGEWISNRFYFALADGRAAEIELKASSMSGETRLFVDKQVIPDVRCLPKDLRCPSCQAEIQLLDDYCAKCGNALGAPDRFLSNRTSIQGATSAIRILAALFVISGVIMFFLSRGEAEAALTSLSQFQDNEVLQPIDGVTYTAGELRRQVVWELWGALIVNLLLSATMLVLAWWSKRKPLPAILVTAAIYAAVLVISAIVDPTTIVKGIVVKAVIITVLARGIKGALAARTDSG
jgi:hypothetical protein